MHTIIQKLFLILIASFCFQTISYAEAARDPMEISADKGLDNLKSWDNLNKWYLSFSPQYDDGYFSEGISEAVEKLLANNWSDFSKFIAMSNKDPNFSTFVIKHLGEITTCENAKIIIKNTLEKCPKGSEQLCRSIHTNLVTPETAPQCLP